MKLYMHPVSTVSRPVRLFIAENKIPVDEEVVDIMTGAQYQPPYATMNPSSLVPMLEDGDLDRFYSQKDHRKHDIAHHRQHRDPFRQGPRWAFQKSQGRHSPVLFLGTGQFPPGFRVGQRPRP